MNVDKLKNVKDLLNVLPNHLRVSDLIKLGVFTSDVTAWDYRRAGKGPKFFKVDKSVYYKKEDIVAWLESNQPPKKRTDRTAFVRFNNFKKLRYRDEAGKIMVLRKLMPDKLSIYVEQYIRDGFKKIHAHLLDPKKLIQDYRCSPTAIMTDLIKKKYKEIFNEDLVKPSTITVVDSLVDSFPMITVNKPDPANTVGLARKMYFHRLGCLYKITQPVFVVPGYPFSVCNECGVPGDPDYEQKS